MIKLKRLYKKIKNDFIQILKQISANSGSGYPSAYDSFPTSASTSLSFEPTPSAFPSDTGTPVETTSSSSPKITEMSMMNDTKNENLEDNGSTKQERLSENGG